MCSTLVPEARGEEEGRITDRRTQTASRMSSKEQNEVAVEKVDNEKATDAKCELKGTKRAAEVSDSIHNRSSPRRSVFVLLSTRLGRDFRAFRHGQCGYSRNVITRISPCRVVAM